MFTYGAKLVRVADGDTVDIDIDLGFGVWLKNERIRLYGIDTPESRTRDKVEKKFGKAAKAFVVNFLDDPAGLTLKCKSYNSKGKYGRIMGDIYRNTDYTEKSVNEHLMEKHHAVPYYGQSKTELVEEHLANRLYLYQSTLEGTPEVDSDTINYADIPARALEYVESLWDHDQLDLDSDAK